jgi:glycerate kinase
MKIVIASDSFKGSAGTEDVGRRMEKGIRKVYPDAEITVVPIADGGEGTVEAVVRGTGGRFRAVEVTGPLGERLEAVYGLLGDGKAVMEMASASGLPLVPEEKRNPLKTTTFGTGELIRDALEQGCREILIGIGGSATTDAGIGMAQALGYSFLNGRGDELGFGGGGLSELRRIEKDGVDPRLDGCRVTVACDVDNPLFGERGAAYVYGPQKGADPDMVKVLDANLRHFADVARESLGRDLSRIPGAGAAGGLGAGLMFFCGAELKSGIDAVLDMISFESFLDGVDLVVTGEGRIDGQTAYGKVPVGISRRAKKHGIPVLAVVGDIGEGASAVYAQGIDGIMSTVNRAMSLKEAMGNSLDLLEDAAERVMRIINIGKRLP